MESDVLDDIFLKVGGSMHGTRVFKKYTRIFCFKMNIKMDFEKYKGVDIRDLYCFLVCMSFDRFGSFFALKKLL